MTHQPPKNEGGNLERGWRCSCDSWEALASRGKCNFLPFSLSLWKSSLKNKKKSVGFGPIALFCTLGWRDSPCRVLPRCNFDSFPAAFWCPHDRHDAHRALLCRPNIQRSVIIVKTVADMSHPSGCSRPTTWEQRQSCPQLHNFRRSER